MAVPPRPTVLTVAGRLEAADAPPLCELVRTSIRESNASTAICDVGDLVGVDAGTVDALARLRLTARRLGCELRLRGASGELLELLAFMGLGDVLQDCGTLDAGGQAEEREQRVGFEEEGELGDAAG